MSFQPQIEYSSLGGNKRKMFSLSQIYTNYKLFEMAWNIHLSSNQKVSFDISKTDFSVTYKLLNHIEIRVFVYYTKPNIHIDQENQIITYMHKQEHQNIKKSHIRL